MQLCANFLTNLWTFIWVPRSHLPPRNLSCLVWLAPKGACPWDVGGHNSPITKWHALLDAQKWPSFSCKGDFPKLTVGKNNLNLGDHGWPWSIMINTFDFTISRMHSGLQVTLQPWQMDMQSVEPTCTATYEEMPRTAKATFQRSRLDPTDCQNQLQWDRLLLCNESHFHLSTGDGRQQIWRREGTGHASSCVAQCNRLGGAKFMFWAGISSNH